MSEEMVYTKPHSNGDKPLPKRAGARTMLPSSWLSRSVRLEFSDGFGSPIETRGVLLDWCGHGPVFNLAGARTVIGWDRLILCALIED